MMVNDCVLRGRVHEEEGEGFLVVEGVGCRRVGS